MKKNKGFIIYLDLLGYKNIIKEKETEEIELLKIFIEEFPNVIIKHAKLCYEKYSDKKFFYKCFSDNFILFYESAAIEETDLSISIFLASSLIGYAICEGFLLRGSIVFGDIEFNDNVVFGNSIVDAYELENNHNEPNITLSKELKICYEKNKLFEEELLSPFVMFDKSDYDEAKKIFNGIEKLIKRLNYQPIVDEKTIKKYEWLIEEFNRYFQNDDFIELIKAPGHFEVMYSNSSSDL